jgi:hypothetical protein
MLPHKFLQGFIGFDQDKLNVHQPVNGLPQDGLCVWLTAQVCGQVLEQGSDVL